MFGAVFLIRWWQGEAPAVFAIPAGVGDVLTGLFAPAVAYWWYTGKPYARTAAILWNLFGMADFVNAVTIANLIQPGIVFPIVMIPVYSVPRAFLIHSYSLIGLLKSTARPLRNHSPGRPLVRLVFPHRMAIPRRQYNAQGARPSRYAPQQ